jgi:hypothetical protein
VWWPAANWPAATMRDAATLIFNFLHLLLRICPHLRVDRDICCASARQRSGDWAMWTAYRSYCPKGRNEFRTGRPCRYLRKYRESNELEVSKKLRLERDWRAAGGRNGDENMRPPAVDKEKRSRRAALPWNTFHDMTNLVQSVGVVLVPVAVLHRRPIVKRVVF